MTHSNESDFKYSIKYLKRLLKNDDPKIYCMAIYKYQRDDKLCLNKNTNDCCHLKTSFDDYNVSEEAIQKCVRWGYINRLMIINKARIDDYEDPVPPEKINLCKENKLQIENELSQLINKI
jgi:hypothetical protein